MAKIKTIRPIESISGKLKKVDADGLHCAMQPKAPPFVYC